MERLTYDFCINGMHCWQVKGADNLECGEVCESRNESGCIGCPIANAFDRLAAIEDILGDDYDLDRLRELVEADRDGRLVMLDEPRKPLIWGDDNHDSILCPNCKHDLMGGFQEADSCEVPMYQCPYCGQPIVCSKARKEGEDGG